MAEPDDISEIMKKAREQHEIAYVLDFLEKYESIYGVGKPLQLIPKSRCIFSASNSSV